MWAGAVTVALTLLATHTITLRKECASLRERVRLLSQIIDAHSHNERLREKRFAEMEQAYRESLDAEESSDIS